MPPAPIVNSSARFPALDSLRALFVLLMLYHFHDFERPMTEATAGQWIYFGAVSLGYLGLDVFFALSGFLITGTLLDAKDAPCYFRAFYARRVLRILPAYALTLAFIFIVLRGWTDQLSVGQKITYWGFLTNFSIARGGFDALVPSAAPLWSIAVEEQFYLVWPIVVYLCSRTTLKRVAIGCLVAAPLVRLVALFTMHPIAGYVLTPARIDAIAIGALVAIGSRERDGLRPYLAWARPAIGIATLVAVGLFTMYGFLAPGPWQFQLVFLTLSPYASAALIVIVLTSEAGGRLQRVLSLRPLRHVALYSYGTYLLHLPVAYYLTKIGLLDRDRFDLWFGTGLASTIAWGATLSVCSVAAGAASWHLLEQPLLHLKRFVPYDGRVPAARPVRQPGLIDAR